MRVDEHAIPSRKVFHGDPCGSGAPRQGKKGKRKPHERKFRVTESSLGGNQRNQPRSLLIELMFSEPLATPLFLQHAVPPPPNQARSTTRLLLEMDSATLLLRIESRTLGSLLETLDIQSTPQCQRQDFFESISRLLHYGTPKRWPVESAKHFCGAVANEKDPRCLFQCLQIVRALLAQAHNKL